MNGSLKSWVKDTAIKSVRTMSQTAVALIGTNTVGVTDIDWLAVGSASLVAGIACVLMALSNITTTAEREAK